MTTQDPADAEIASRDKKATGMDTANELAVNSSNKVSTTPTSNEPTKETATKSAPASQTSDNNNNPIILNNSPPWYP